MEEYRCPAAHENKEAHAMLLATLGNYRQRYETSGYLATDAQKLVHTIDRWLDEHILGVDVQLRSYVKK